MGIQSDSKMVYRIIQVILASDRCISSSVRSHHYKDPNRFSDVPFNENGFGVCMTSACLNTKSVSACIIITIIIIIIYYLWRIVVLYSDVHSAVCRPQPTHTHIAFHILYLYALLWQQEIHDFH